MKKILTILLFFVVFSSYAQENNVNCGTKNEVPAGIQELINKLPTQPEQFNLRSSAENVAVCRIAVEIDSDTYFQYQGDTSAIYRRVLENIERASRIFERDINTRLIVTSIRIWKDHAKDPFAVSNSLAFLINVFANTSAARDNYDKRVYLFTKSSSDFGGIAQLGGVHSVAPLLHVGTTLHELGHTFGSPHTNSCSWPGGPIDYCNSIEDGDCYQGALETMEKATVMTSCYSGSGINAGFHPLCQALMRMHAANFPKISKSPQTVQLPKIESAAVGDVLYWPVSDLATSYEISYSSQSNFSKETIFKTSFNGLVIPDLPTASDSYFRVRAVNSFGNSEWSESRKVKLFVKNLTPPRLLKPAGDKIIVAPNTPVLLSFTNVPGATNYEIQVTDCLDIRFSNSNILTTNGNEYSYTPPYVSCFRWRIRAVSAQTKGVWSDDFFLSVNPLQGDKINFPTLANGTIPGSFPFSYSAKGSNSHIRITISENQTFANPLLQKQYNPYTICSDYIKGLPPGKQLYMKLEEWNDDTLYYPKGNMTDVIVSLVTNSASMPANLTFLSENDQKLFGWPSMGIAITDNYIWWLRTFVGLVRIDNSSLSYDVYNVKNSLGRASMTFPSDIKSSKDNKLRLVNRGQNYTLRYLKLKTEDITGPSDLVVIPDLNTPNFNGDADLFWQMSDLFRLSGNNRSLLRAFGAGVYIKDVKVYQSQAWVLASNGATGTDEISVLNLSDGSIIRMYNYSNTTALRKSISQIEIAKTGIVWLRQYDPNSGLSSITSFDGSSWVTFDSTNSPLSNGVSSIRISPSNVVYALDNMPSETRIYKYSGSQWSVVGEPISLANFASQLYADGLENIWLVGNYGIARLANAAPVLGTSNQEEIIKLYPNPTNDKIVLEIGSLPGRNLPLLLINSSGIVVSKFNARPGHNIWDISHLPSGVFIVAPVDDKSRPGWKIVKN